MRVKDLIAHLQELPENADVYVPMLNDEGPSQWVSVADVQTTMRGSIHLSD
jgi:hypothetical protein